MELKQGTRAERSDKLLERAREYLSKFGLGDSIMVHSVSTATVTLAAAAIGCTEAEIAKSLTFRDREGAMMIVTDGIARIDNRKFKDTFGFKARMLSGEELEEMVGFLPGGVCPFGVKDGVKIYFDKSLKNHEVVYPACGSSDSAIRLELSKLEEIVDFIEYVDVSKEG